MSVTTHWNRPWRIDCSFLTSSWKVPRFAEERIPFVVPSCIECSRGEQPTLHLPAWQHSSSRFWPPVTSSSTSCHIQGLSFLWSVWLHAAASPLLVFSCISIPSSTSLYPFPWFSGGFRKATLKVIRMLKQRVSRRPSGSACSCTDRSREGRGRERGCSRIAMASPKIERKTKRCHTSGSSLPIRYYSCSMGTWHPYCYTGTDGSSCTQKGW